jgi:DNA-binding XRE family transcriptional regulator
MKDRSVARAFGAVLKAARKAKGLSQEELAADAAIDRTYPSLLERGLREPTLTVLIQLADALDCTPAALVNATLCAAHRMFPEALAAGPAHGTGCAGAGPAGGISPEAVPINVTVGRANTPTPCSSTTAAAQPPQPIRPHRAHDGPRVRRAP